MNCLPRSGCGSSANHPFATSCIVSSHATWSTGIHSDDSREATTAMLSPFAIPSQLFHGRVWWLHPSLENARRLGPPRQGETLTHFIHDLRVGVLKVQQNLFPQQQLFVFEQGLKVRRETGMELLLFCSELDSSFHPFLQGSWRAWT